MNRPCKLSEVTKNYLTAFYCILDDMISGMTTAELTNSISNNFIVQMIPHHMAAIEMSKNLLKYTANLELQELAQQIVSEQTKSIENMRAIQCQCGELVNSPQELRLYQRRTDQIIHTMFSEMEQACSDNRINCNFMREMIPHHEGAVRMSENTLKYDICPGLVPILHAIITSQKRGISQMRSLQRRIVCV
ncbi:MAG: DUF305 domain-containing protein [Oscillospiraceae bacterium]